MWRNDNIAQSLSEEEQYRRITRSVLDFRISAATRSQMNNNNNPMTNTSSSVIDNHSTNTSSSNIANNQTNLTNASSAASSSTSEYSNTDMSTAKPVNNFEEALTLDILQPRHSASVVSDEAVTHCRNCNRQFSVTLRKHHCR